MGSGIGGVVEILMEDDQKFEAKFDQRDAAAFERSEFYTENGHNTRLRFIAWNALRRAGETKLPFTKFDATCVDVSVKDQDEVDPTNSDQPSGD